MKIHELKIWPEYFKLILSEDKKYEIRKDDRKFEIDDFLHLREWKSKGKRYTKRSCIARITKKKN